MFKNRVLREIFEPNGKQVIGEGEGRKLHNDELYDL